MILPIMASEWKAENPQQPQEDFFPSGPFLSNNASADALFVLFCPRQFVLKPIIAPGSTAKVNYNSIWMRWRRTLLYRMVLIFFFPSYTGAGIKHLGRAGNEPGSPCSASICSNYTAMNLLSLWYIEYLVPRTQNSVTNLWPIRSVIVEALSS